MKKIGNLLIISLLLTLVMASSDYTYTATGPKLVRPHTNYTLNIVLESTSQGPMTFSIQIKSFKEGEIPFNPIILRNEATGEVIEKIEEPKDVVLYTSEKLTVAPGEFKDLKVYIKELPKDENRFNLTITGEADGLEKNIEDSSLIYKDTKTQSLLLQTDKPIYKPGETVKFRILMLNRFLRPLKSESVELTILDPQQNVIKIWKNEKLENGLLANSLTLSPEPILGDWTLRALSNGQTESMTFNVDQYVLPKFKVDVKLPPFITFNNSKLTAEIQAAYTYGKPLVGDVLVKITEFQQYRWGDPPKVITKKSPINGSAFFEFDVVKELETEKLTYEKEYEVSATVTDVLTGRTQNASAKIRAHQYPYKIEMVEEERNYKPGFPLTLKFKVSSQDGIPVSDPDPKALKIEHGYSFRAEDGVAYFSIPPTGIVELTVDTPTNELMSASSVEVTYKELRQNFYPPQRLHSASKTYMSLTLDTKKPAVDSSLGVTIKLNKPFSSFTYVLYGRGEVLESKKIVVSNGESTKEHKFNINVPRGAAPEATLLVYTVVMPTREVAVDNVQFSLSSVFDNFLNMTLSKASAEPGEKISLNMESSPNSHIALRGVDQSVLLLKEDKDITVKTIEGEVKSFQSQLNNYRMWGGSSAFQLFESTGLIVLTNAVLEKERYVRRPFYSGGGLGGAMVMRKGAVMMADNAMAFAAPQSLESSRAPGGSPDEPRVRKDFPETFIWESYDSPNATFVLEKVVPDTLTSWIITGYSLSPEYGIGLTESPLTLRTFRPFFITLNKPYSIVNGEVFGLQVLVHNYMEKEVTAQVTLDNSDTAFEFYSETDKTAKSLTKSIILEGVGVKSVVFVIKPLKFGIIKLDAKAVCPLAGDALSQPLIVKPPGQKENRNKAVLLDLRNGGSFKATLQTAFPPKRVEGADVVKISVISDLLGSTINNLDKLLQMPCGCGEQNMLNFVPDIVILEYLTAAGTLTDEIKKKAVHFLETGYQRELTYKHIDGSFSAFGESDQSGSTWLTAFVARSFIAARPHITIDSKVILGALRFLASKQQSDGSFVEHGTVIHSEMKGGSADSYSLSSYVLLAFIEASKSNISSTEEMPDIEYTKVIQKGIEYILTAPKSSDSTYLLTLVTYTLQAAKHEAVGTFKEEWEKLAKSEGDLTFWEPPKKKLKETNETSKIITHHRVQDTKPVSVEMTAYALLIYLNDNNLEKALSVGRWLLGQRNAEGGFISTQDTVVGLTAIGKFALATRAKDNNMIIKAAGQSFNVNNENAMVLQEVFLPSDTTEVSFEAEGLGTALVQLSYSYYVEDKTELPVFAVKVQAESGEKSEGNVLKLKVCTSYESVDGKKSESNMAVLEINLPSGFVFDSSDLSHLSEVEKVKRHELDDGNTKLSIYFDSLDSVERCVEIGASRIFKIGNPAEAYVSVYDYYDTTRRARAFYAPPGLSPCDICESDESCSTQNCI